MNTQTTVWDRLTALSGVTVADDGQSLAEDLGLDSLAMVMLLLDLEDTFGFTLEESDMNPAALMTVDDVVALAVRYVADGHA